MRSLIIGGTGFVGRHLVAGLENPIVAGRSLGRIHQRFAGIEAREWTSEQDAGDDVLAGVCVDGEQEVMRARNSACGWSTFESEWFSGGTAEPCRKC